MPFVFLLPLTWVFCISSAYPTLSTLTVTFSFSRAIFILILPPLVNAQHKGFNPDRVRNGLANLKKAKKKGGQKRIDSFFGFKPAATAKGTKKGKGAGSKRKGSSNLQSKKSVKKSFFGKR